MTRPTDDQIRWMVRHPIMTLICFIVESPFYLLYLLNRGMIWIMVKTETEEERKIRRRILCCILKTVRKYEHKYS